MEEYVNERLLQSYVKHKGKEYFVSTINRNCSAMGMHSHVYAETMVWEWDRNAGKAGELVGQDESGRNCIKAHLKMIERIYSSGKFSDDDDS